ncbi:putative lipoprotein [Borreliella afzelii HLJ01]|nr:putative lipoprotein [Borreliella afzelii HLJ01]
MENGEVVKTKIIIFLLILSILSCSKSVSNEVNSEFIIKTKNIKAKEILKNKNILHIDAKIPFMKNANFEFENFIKKWKKDIENKISKPENTNNEYFYFSNFTIFKNENIGITSILYKESLKENESNTFLKYYSLNLKGNKKIEISEIISKDQLDSLINVLKEQVKSKIIDFNVKDKYNLNELEKKFTTIFPRYKYYFKNNQIIIFYSPFLIDCNECDKIEFQFPLHENTENGYRPNKTPRS